MKKNILIIWLSLFLNSIEAQVCTAPSFNVNLSAAADTSWTLADTERGGVCCGSSNCVTFNVTLNPGTELVSFFVTSPSPSGSAFYQINCGPPISIGVPFCAIGLASPFTITYCKPGGDSPNYIITAGTIVHASHDISMRETGCTDTLFVSNVLTSSIVWTSISPGSMGDYDNYLSCTSGCSSTLVTPIGTPPPYVDFEVSGNPSMVCGSISLRRDTVRVNFVPQLTAIISPATPIICASSSTPIVLTATPLGGALPYQYTWSTGAHTSSISVSAAGTYSVTINDHTNCPPIILTKTVGTIPTADFTYSGSPFCANDINPLPGYLGSSQPGIFSATPSGLSFINTSTGEVNLAASSPGTYIVTNTIAPFGACTGASATATITINPFPVMTSTTSASICSGSTLNIPFTSTVGSTYSWIASDNTNTSGESLTTQTSSTLNNTITNTSNTPETISYTVTPTSAVGGGCAGSPQTITVTVNPMDDASFTYIESTSCQTGTNPTTIITGLSGGTFSSTAGLVFVSSTTGTIDLASSSASPTPYVVTYTTNGVCPNTETFSILITLAPSADFSYTGTPFCQNETNPSPTFVIGGGAGIFTSTPGLVFTNPITGELDLSASTPGTYTITNTIAASGGCATSIYSSTITITELAIATFNYSGTPYCQNSTNPTPAFSGGGVAGTFSAPSGLNINPSTGLINLIASTPGTYVVTNSFPATGGCPPVIATSTVTITALPIANFSYIGTPYCQTDANPSPTFVSGGVAGIFTPSSVFLNMNSSSGEINLAASVANSYFVTNTIAAAGGCPSVSATAPITITQLPLPTFVYLGTPYCQNGIDPTPVLGIGGTNGIFTSSPAGANIDSIAGTVNLLSSLAGTYTVTNTITASGGCPTVSASATLTITSLPISTFSYFGATYCQNSTDPSPAFSGGGIAGIFTEPVGLIINPITGQVDLTASIPGTYNVTNTILAANGCPDVSTTSSITINPSAQASAGSDAIICSGNTLTLSGSINGGASSLIWTTSGSGTFDNAFSPNAVYTPSFGDRTLGTVTLSINTNDPIGPCPSVVDNVLVTITPRDNPSFNFGSSTFCQTGTDPTPTITGVTGGTFTSSSPSLIINGLTGSIDLGNSALGTYTITYHTAGPCPDSASTVITVTVAPSATFNYSATSYCLGAADPLPIFTIGSSGGVFTSAAGLVIDPITGLVNLTNSIPGTYLITNSIAASGGCASSTASASITIAPLDDAAFNYSSAAYCESENNQSPLISGVMGGSFISSPIGMPVNPVTGEIVISACTPGNYTVTYTTNGTCFNTSSVNVLINEVPVANAGANIEMICGAPSILLDGSGSDSGSGINYLWNTTDGNIISGNSTTTPIVNQTGIYYITVTDNNGCWSTDTIVVSASSIMPIASFTTSPIALTGTAPFVMNFTNTSQNSNTFIWSFGDGSATTSVINANNTFNTPGTYTVILISSNNGICFDTASVMVVITDPFFIPGGFSPNDDGVNDRFVIRGINRYPMNKFVVFNRWGNKVYEAHPYNSQWDGKCAKGLRIGDGELPVGVYFYVLDLGDGSKEIKGNIYLNK